ncbi:hypothetical protein FMM56_04590 [Campylobacter sp. LR264d]|uniref:hypothetical protein n=1 Tax=Campylobacter sp. LR264d TaxID=2593544 RepID=UPI00123B2AEB|nr:hypothetical protein [Campylobacter sp. LR264d]KAA6231429.1 hypothetical protein FMM56_04590 [Campylobacter sp. LR264d]
MVKKLFFISLFTTYLFGINSLELANNLVNNPAKYSQIELLFKNQSHKDSNGNLNIDTISRILKSNSLLNLTLSNSQSLKLNFKARADSVVFFKIINDALNDAGYTYFITTDLIIKDDFIDYTIRVETKYVLDPGTFYNLLKSSAVFIDNIKKLASNHYEYELNFSNAIMKTNTRLDLNVPKTLEKPFKDYTISLINARSINIKSSDSDNWYPKILFLDRNLNLIKSINSTSKKKVLNEAVPSAASYVIISDMYTLDNIKRGLEVTLK